MKLNRSKKPIDEKQSSQERNELTEFYELLDGLLPQKNELLRDTLEKSRKSLEDTLEKRGDDRDCLLELEKGKNSCLHELLKIFVDQCQRVSADYANFQKRAPKQIADTVAYEREKIIKTLLPVLDNFEHTLQKAYSAKDIEVFLKGVQIIYDQMLDILRSHGVEQIEAAGEKFDPALHQAMMQQAEPQHEQDIVLEEFEKGYKLNGRVIRPSRVIVNKLPSEAPVERKEQAEQIIEETEEETTDTQ
jgi:molecular chaperone GrpE